MNKTQATSMNYGASDSVEPEISAIGSEEEETMFRMKQNWIMVALLAIPAMAQQYPPPPQPPQQQYPDPQQQGQYPQQQYPQQQPAYNPPQTKFAPDQLDQMVSRIALYPDPLL